MPSLSELMRAYFKAYKTKDRAALESTISSDFTFTSPYDDHIDRIDLPEALLAKQRANQDYSHKKAVREWQRSLCSLRPPA